MIDSGDYEKLESVGDAILDYVIGINMMRYTMFERYLPQHGESDLTESEKESLLFYRHSPDYQPKDAHQAKLKLAKNELLAKMSCVLGLHQYVFFYDNVESMYSKKDVRDYLNYSFTYKNFPMNQRRIEPFETPKILGDIFESLIGAVYEDSGLDEVHRVFRHILSPMILFGTQFSKLAALYGEPKEQMQWKCNEYKIKPKYLVEDVPQIQKVYKNKVHQNGDDTTFSSDNAPNFTEAEMIKCSIIFRHGKTMCHSFGSSRRQAERNAAVMGLKWIEESKEELETACRGKAKAAADHGDASPTRGATCSFPVRKPGLETALKFTRYEDEELEQIEVKKMR